MNNRPSGARQRFVGIFSCLIRQLPQVEFVVFEPEDCRVGEWFEGAANVTARRTPLPSEDRIRRYLRGLVYWRSVFAGERFDIFENLHLPFVDAPGSRTILTIHDIRELSYGSKGVNSFLRKRFLRRAFRSVDQVITVSETLKKEILALFPNVRISVVHNGVDVDKFVACTERDVAEFREQIVVPNPFVLAVGHFGAEKRTTCA